MDARVAPTIGRVPIIIFGAADDVLGVGESRNPAPVDQLRVPADMVPVQVRAHDIIDFLGLHAPTSASVQRKPVLSWWNSGRAAGFLVIAAAGVYQHRIAIGLHHESVVAHVDVAVPRQLTLRQFPLTNISTYQQWMRKKIPAPGEQRYD